MRGIYFKAILVNDLRISTRHGVYRPPPCTNNSHINYQAGSIIYSHLEALDVTVQALTIIPDRVETQHVAIILDEPSPPAVIHRVAESSLREHFHVVLVYDCRDWGSIRGACCVGQTSANV